MSETYLHEIIIAIRPHLRRAVVLCERQLIAQLSPQGVIAMELRIFYDLRTDDRDGEPHLGVRGGPAMFEWMISI